MASRNTERTTKSHAVMHRLRVLMIVGVIGCRGDERSPADRATASLTARTLGLAYLQENQLAQAESAFRNVVALTPEQALGYANLGLVYLRQGRLREAETEVRRAAALDSSDDNIALMLAAVYELSGRRDAARQEIERVLRRSPDELRALYALARLAAQSPDSGERRRSGSYLERIVERAPGNIAARLELVDFLLAGGSADSAAGLLEALERQLPELPRETARFFDGALRLARAGNAAAATAPATMFHHLMETTSAYQASRQRLLSASGPLAGFPILRFNPNLAAPPPGAATVAAAVHFSDVTASAGLGSVPPFPDTGLRIPGPGVALAVGDYDGNGREDLFVSGHLFRNEFGRSIETTEQAGVGSRDVPVAAAFGDYDNDGRLDLYIATSVGGALYHNDRDSTLRDVTAGAGLRDAPPAAAALFMDLDHDGDLDLFLASPSGNRAYRNPLDGPFAEMSVPMGLAGPAGGSRAAAFGDLDGDGHTDLLVVGNDGRVTLFRNAGQGRFQDVTAASGLAPPGRAGGGAVAVGDYDNDGFLDVFLGSLDGTTPVLYRNRSDGTFELDSRARAPLRALRGSTLDAAFFDFDNDGFQDLVVAGASPAPGGRGVFLFRNDATGRFVDRSAALPGDVGGGRRVAAVDYDGDGDQDLVVAGWDGRPRLLLNDGGNANQYVQVQLTALRTGSGKNNVFGVGSTLELRAGDLYAVRVVTGRVTHFGLEARIKADVLRVRWPNGVSQTVYYPARDEDILEEQILKGSCPYLYAWNGHAFEFVTDVMWRSALGMPLGIMAGGTAIESAPPHASREYMRIPGRALVARDGRYLLQITEELWETAYLDHVKLLVVDHPESLAVYVDEGFVPPAPGPAPLRLYPVARARPPVAATDERGADWRPALLERDDRYVAPLTPTRYQGIAAPHDLVLDFGDLNGLERPTLFLTGWIFPTDASINLALAYSRGAGSRVIAPYLEVKDRAGRWRRVAEVPFPSGKNKTVIVDLTGKFLSDDTRIRIRTNMEIYWDQAFVASPGPASAAVVATLDPVAADLHYRGFSRASRRGGRYGPQWPAYEAVTLESSWEPIVGAYTRYGDVLPLLQAADDMYAIVAPGDETTLAFDAGTAPPLAAGWARDFVLYTDAWLKDSDRNTAAGATVEPLPFHGMSRYPYGPDEAYPRDPGHRRYRESYNTRRVDQVFTPVSPLP